MVVSFHFHCYFGLILEVSISFIHNSLGWLLEGLQPFTAWICVVWICETYSQYTTVYRTLILCMLQYLPISGIQVYYLIFFTTLFFTLGDVHNYNTRYATNQNLYKPRVRTNTSKQIILFKAIDLWNSIPKWYQLNEFAFSLKKIKHYLLSEQYLSNYITVPSSA